MNLNSITFPGLDGAYQIATDYRIVNGVKEWVNPPMEPGVEYRTTELWNGKPVYRQLVVKSFSNDVGNATGFAGVDFSHNVYFVNIVRANIVATSGDASYTFNMRSSKSAGYGGVVANGFFNIELRNMSIASPTFYVDIAYVNE